LIASSSLASLPGVTLSKLQLAPSEWEFVAGLPVATVQRALFDEVVRRRELWAGVEAVCMAAAARLISVRLFSSYVVHRTAWEGVPLVRKVLQFARDEFRSPPEVRMHLVWELVAELGRLPLESCAWTLEPPVWYQVPESLDDYFARLGLVERLTHR
jgi:hypothetical protein